MSTSAPAAAFVPCSRETWRAPWAMYAALRDHDPVHHVADRDYWVLSRWDDVFAATFAPGHFVRRHETLPFVAQA